MHITTKYTKFLHFYSQTSIHTTPLYISSLSSCKIDLFMLFLLYSIPLCSHLIVATALQALLSQFFFIIYFIIPAFRRSYHSHLFTIHITKGGKSMNTSEKHTDSTFDSNFPAKFPDFEHAHGPVPYCLTNDYLFRAVLQQSNPALKGLSFPRKS